METVATTNPAQILGLAIIEATGRRYGARAIAVQDDTYPGGVKLRIIARSRAGAMCAYDSAARIRGMRVDRYEIRVKGYQEIFIHDGGSGESVPAAE